MNNIKILDCTLRDGGYVNDWSFGKKNIKKIIRRLIDSNVDAIEIGFFEDAEYNENRTFFSCLEDISSLSIGSSRKTKIVGMTRLNKLNIDHLKENDGKTLDLIRVTFHIDEIEEAITYCQQIQGKGYDVSVQPVGTTSYTDEELLRLIGYVNELEPYAFSIVDTLGVMTKKDIYRFLHLIDHNLKSGIGIGFHSHNNLQLSLSNAQEIIEFNLDREVIIDASIHGMGRGAGNLHTELLAQLINSKGDKRYDLIPLVEIIDNYIMFAKSEYEWGYSIPYYLAAIKKCHPNYASFLMNKKTLDIGSISHILHELPSGERERFNETLAKEVYSKFQSHYVDDNEVIEYFTETFKHKEVLILAPGNSIVEERNYVQEYIDNNNPIVISINFVPEYYKVQYSFFSNIKRYKNCDNLNFENTITTSNIQDTAPQYCINYSKYLNDFENVKDNAVLMCLELLRKIKLQKIIFAGFDGYRIDANSIHYRRSEMETQLEDKFYLEMNDGISKYISGYRKQKEIDFLTDSIYNI